jgi:uncharacterized alkaline shock family protein YloU
MATERMPGSAGDAPATPGTATQMRPATETRPGDTGQISERRGATTSPMTAGRTALTTETGTTRIADSVVAKVAGLAARDIPGVYSMGTGMARRVGQLRSLVPGSDQAAVAGQGVNVTVGEREAVIDLDLVTWYGQSIVDISDAVRRHVIGQVEGMTGLKVNAVNIEVDDIHVEGDQQAAAMAGAQQAPAMAGAQQSQGQ